MADKHKVALVGLGMVSGAHARSLEDLSDRVEVAHAFSPTEARRARFAETFDFPLTGDLDAIMADRTTDSVIVISPANTHLDIARAAAEAGKNVLLEKPVEVSTDRAEELVDICERNGVTLGIVLQHRFRPAAERLRAILDAGRLGRVLSCSTRIDLWRPQSYYDEPGRGSFARDGGGVLLSQGIHTLDLMLSLAGPVKAVTGVSRTTAVHEMETEDLVAALLDYESGAVGTLEASTAAYPGFAERIRLICTEGSAVLEGTGLEVHFQDGTTDEVAPIETSGGTGANPMDFPHDWHRDVLADFLTAVETGGAPRVTGREALRVHRLIDALMACGPDGRRVAVTAETT